MRRSIAIAFLVALSTTAASPEVQAADNDRQAVSIIDAAQMRVRRRAINRITGYALGGDENPAIDAKFAKLPSEDRESGGIKCDVLTTPRRNWRRQEKIEVKTQRLSVPKG